MSRPIPDLEDIADDFLRRIRLGERPNVQAYAEEHPELAAEITEMLTSIAMMEQLSQRESELRHQASAVTKPTNRIERLSEFDLVREIGRGGMGVVYEAIDRTLDRRVALKVLNDSALATPKHVDRFRREARLAAQLHHTNIVSVFGVGCENGTHFYAMQFVEGVSLQDVLDGLRATESPVREFADQTSSAAVGVALALRDGLFAESRNVKRTSTASPESTSEGGRDATTAAEGSQNAALAQTMQHSDSHCSETPDAPAVSVETETKRSATSDPRNESSRFGIAYWRSVARIGLQVADALHYAHVNGILHRDIKPANLLIDDKGTVWVADFGLAKLAETNDLTQTGDVVGTLRYMAPEQLAGQADRRTDVHALGQTLYELLTLRPLCDGETYREIFAKKQRTTQAAPRKLNPLIPRDLSTIVQKSTEHEPAKRYDSAKSLADDLQRFLDDRPILARRVTLCEHAWRWCRRNRAMAALAALSSALVLLLPVVLGWAYVREVSQKEQTERTLSVALDGFDELFRAFHDNEVATASALSDSGDVESLTPAMVTKDTARVLERMLVFYDRLAEASASSSNTELTIESAKARRRVGDLYQQLGQFSKATEAYDEATTRYLALASRDASLRIEIGRIHQAKGTIYAQKLEFRPAMREYRQALEVFQDIKDNQSSKYEVARTHYLLSAQPSIEAPSVPGEPGPRTGGPARRGPRRRPPPERMIGPSPAAETTIRSRNQELHLGQAIKLVGELLEDEPNSAAYRLLLALCLRETADEKLFDPNSSTPRARAAKLLRDLVAQFPTNPRYRFELSETYRAFGNEQIRPDESRRYIDQLLVARELSEQLVLEQRDVASYRIHLAHIHAHLGVEYGRLGRIRDSEASTLEAIAAHESVARDFPGLADLSRRLAMSDKVRLARWYAEEARWEELVAVIRPLAESLAEAVDTGVESSEQQETLKDLSACRDLLLRAYDHLGDAEGYLVAFSWPFESQPRGARSPEGHRRIGPDLRPPRTP